MSYPKNLFPPLIHDFQLFILQKYFSRKGASNYFYLLILTLLGVFTLLKGGNPFPTSEVVTPI